MYLYSKNKLDSAIYYIKKASIRFERIEFWERQVYAINGLAFLYHQNKNHIEFKNATYKAYEVSTTYLEPNNAIRTTALSSLNSHYFSIGDFTKSIDILKEVIELNKLNKQKKVTKLELAVSYLNLGNSYKFAGDSQKALSFQKKALELQKDSIAGNSLISKTYQSIGMVFQLENQIDSTINYFEKAEKLLHSVNNNSPLFDLKIENLINLAELWNTNGNNLKARSYIEKVQQLSLNEYFQVHLKEAAGKILLSEGKEKEAIEAFLKGNEIAEKYNKRNTPPLKARRLIELANAYRFSGDFTNELSTFQKGLQVLSPGFESDNFQDNPLLVKDILDQLDALTILTGKAKSLLQLFNKTKDQRYLITAYESYRLASDLISNIRQSTLSIESKKILSKKNVSVYEGAIQCALDLFQLTGDVKYKEAAFQLAESNKALLLLESINDQTAKGFAGIPDSLLEKEKDLKLNLAFLQNELLNNKSEERSGKNIEDQIFNLNQQLDHLTDEFEKNYPRYFELKYQNDPIDLNSIQQELAKNNNALLEYFVGEKAIYLFVVTADDLEIQTIEHPQSVNDAIQQLRPILNNSPGTKPQEEFTQFTSSAHTLYKILLKSALEKLPQDITGITFIPDDQLNYIPFSILLTEAADQRQPSYAMADLAYLMTQYPINYHYSATLLHKSRQRKPTSFENNFIGFAPSFLETETIASRTCASDELYSLKCSGEEVAAISELVGGLTYINEQANKSTFEQFASSCRILHLATHACIDEQDANFNKIFFTDDFLSNFDLYNLELNTELAVLSACNTGSGELIKGEGVMSLARGFINAGCSSTLMSMWSVDDCATSDIMVNFYKNLKEGLSKDEALRSAKLEYLQSATKTKMHPYYWAAFVPFGDMEAMEINKGINPAFYLIPLIILSWLFVFYRKK